MATYAIGDLQGCYVSLRELLDTIAFDPTVDRLWCVGDLVNRGHRSLDVLRFIKGLGDSVRVVLGNHDVFLLAVACGAAALRQKDTIGDILTAPDFDELIAWLRNQPLIHREGDYLMVHAGLLPQWTAAEAAALADEIESALAGPDWAPFLAKLIDEPPPVWRDDLTGWPRWSAALRAFTRLRGCTEHGEMSDFSGPPDGLPPGFRPWFRIRSRRSTDALILFGHWAALGLYMGEGVVGLDSGCVWGRRLTAVRLEDRRIFQVPCGAGGRHPHE